MKNQLKAEILPTVKSIDIKPLLTKSKYQLKNFKPNIIISQYRETCFLIIGWKKLLEKLWLKNLAILFRKKNPPPLIAH